jgi:hypothetical protein
MRLSLLFTFLFSVSLQAADLPVVADVEGQPLGANIDRVIKSLEFLGAPLPDALKRDLEAAITAQDAKKLQQLLDSRVLIQVSINPEARVKAARGPAETTLHQHGYVPLLVKVVNESTVKKKLKVTSAQAGPVHSQKEVNNRRLTDRFLDLSMYTSPPMLDTLSGLKVEYAILLVYSSQAGKREATIGFDIGQGSQDLGFRGEVPVLFEIKPAMAVKLGIKEADGKPTVARFTFTDQSGHVYPSQAKRVAPDFFFHSQIYRPDGGTVLLPPGKYQMAYGRGPEYLFEKKAIEVPAMGEARIDVVVNRWINPAEYGWYSGDHHIHAAGCAHYTSPTEGVMPEDMFLHVKGEGLNVGCCLTWGPCFEYQRTFFDPNPHPLSEPLTLLKYDLEVSGFGSQALGHVCLLNLRDQTYPGSEGTKTKGWPTWTTPLMRWAKLQGAYTGYAHSASGLQVDASKAAKRLLESLDTDRDSTLNGDEAAKGLLPLPFAKIDSDNTGNLTLQELTAAHTQAVKSFPNLAIPEMNGIGAQEICVTTAMKVCDFISAMDTDRGQEWNCWYHLMNCGFPLKASGETDFPCISGGRVGQGRVYVQLGRVDKVDYAAWCEGVGKGRSYVSDGYSHALQFAVNDQPTSGEVKLDQAGQVRVKAKVAFSKDLSLGTSVGGQQPQGDQRSVELVVNGVVVDKKTVAADNAPHDIEFNVPIEKSSWVAIRHWPTMHTNPVNVIVAGKPIRASKDSARWCIGVIEQLWRARQGNILPAEREEADKTFKKAIEVYKQIASES